MYIITITRLLSLPEHGPSQCPLPYPQVGRCHRAELINPLPAHLQPAIPHVSTPWATHFPVHLVSPCAWMVYGGDISGVHSVLCLRVSCLTVLHFGVFKSSLCISIQCTVQKEWMYVWPISLATLFLNLPFLCNQSTPFRISFSPTISFPILFLALTPLLHPLEKERNEDYNYDDDSDDEMSALRTSQWSMYLCVLHLSPIILS